MTYKLKALGLALVAAFAMSAFAAPAVQAGVFDAEKVPTEVSGAQLEGGFEFGSVVAVWKCTTFTLQGELGAKESSELTLAPSYSGCKWGGLNAAVEMKGCNYVFTPGEKSGSKVAVVMHIKCPIGVEASLNLVGSTCKIKFPSQTLTGVTAENKAGSKETIVVEYNIKEVEYTVENGKACPNQPADGVYKNGTLKGKSTLTGKSGSEEVNIAVT